MKHCRTFATLIALLLCVPASLYARDRWTADEQAARVKAYKGLADQIRAVKELPPDVTEALLSRATMLQLPDRAQDGAYKVMLAALKKSEQLEPAARAALEASAVAVGRMLHPSPASPAANRGWAECATRQLRELDVELP